MKLKLLIILILLFVSSVSFAAIKTLRNSTNQRQNLIKASGKTIWVAAGSTVVLDDKDFSPQIQNLIDARKLVIVSTPTSTKK